MLTHVRIYIRRKINTGLHLSPQLPWLILSYFILLSRYSYDDEILEWMMARFDGNLVVTAQDLQNYGLSLIQKEDPSFKASSGWALR
jgi:hypothetical protein